jgi:chorismate mutase
VHRRRPASCRGAWPGGWRPDRYSGALQGIDGLAAVQDAQQLTPEDLSSVIKGLVIRSSQVDHTAEDALAVLRGQIDRIDNYLLELMSERMGIARQIGEFKRDAGITILQTGRWDEIVRDRVKTGAEKELTEKFVLDLMEAVHKESIRNQTKVMNEDKE